MVYDSKQLTDASPSQAVTSASEDTIGEFNSVNRRGFIGTSAAAIMGLALTQMNTESVDAQAIGSHKQPRSSMMILPSAVSTQLAPLFVQNSPPLQLLNNNFVDQGFQFIPERAIVAVYEDEGDAASPPGGPCMLLIWPTFKTFSSTDLSQEAASIIAVQKCGTIGGVAASHVVVTNHTPFQISEFSVLDIDKSTGVPQIVSRSATRAQVQTKTAAQLAALLGSPPFDATTAQEMPSMNIVQMKKIAGGTFAELLCDAYAGPQYTLEARAQLLKDTSLVTKWSDANRLRYSTVFASMVACCCCSTNASCCSSSCFSINW